MMTDLQNPQGKMKFQIKPKSTFDYELAITPLLGGVYTASITFVDSEERFIWWTVEVRTGQSETGKDSHFTSVH